MYLVIGLGLIPGQVMWDLWWTEWDGVDFVLVLQFPLPIFISPTAPHPLIILSSVLYSLDAESLFK
jgi:hypothetical protein